MLLLIAFLIVTRIRIRQSPLDCRAYHRLCRQIMKTPPNAFIVQRYRVPVVAEANRSDYAMVFTLRHRKTFSAMSVDERVQVLTAGAEALDEYARQMRTEAQEIAA